jgi:resuscitation-promoting factor RpfB
MEMIGQKTSNARVRVVALFFLTVLSVSVFLVTYVQAASEPAPRFGQRLITLHDRGRDRGILTYATTLRQALEEASIHLDPNDTVEPGLDQVLAASNYDVNIYRARPVTIVDGSMRKKIMSPHQTADQIAKQADIDLQKEDITTITANTDMVSQGAGVQLTIDRAIPLNLVLYGEKTTVYTHTKTVAQLLKEKEIILAATDTISVPLDTPITKGMTIEIWRNGIQTITVEEDIDFPVEQQKDPDRFVGYREIETPGEKGTKKVTYEINRQNGQEVGRKEIQSITTKEPKKQVEIVGTKPEYTPYTGTGTKTDWLAASAIPEENWGAADAIVSQESGWNPNAVNPSSGACGLAQALPCSKVPGNPYDPVNSLNWMHGYVVGRYGGWEEALAFKREKGWY